MVGIVQSSAVHGVEAFLVRVEADTANGLPNFSIVGLPDNPTRESRDRVASAIRNSGFLFPPKRVTVNLAPADTRKEGAAFDLAIALAVLAATEQLDLSGMEETLFLGELSLDGNLHPIPGAVAIAADARRHGIRSIVLPAQNAEEAAVVDRVRVYGVKTLQETVDFICKSSGWKPTVVDIEAYFASAPDGYVDLSDVRGQEHAKRALEVAAVGGHNLLMIGPPGSGKTMLARRLATILPSMTLDEALETTKIHSVAGVLPPDVPLLTVRPFRSPHHTVSTPGLIGGGTTPKPGEVSLAHNGVLFLDELPEFQRNALEGLRQPIEEGQATIARTWGSLTFPARAMLVAAMNPCPCGFLGDGKRPCRCAPAIIQRYRDKISGPLLDRIDLHIEVPAVPYEDLRGQGNGEPSATVRERVQTAREIQKHRFKGLPMYCNAMMDTRSVRRFCKLDDSAEVLLGQAMTTLLLSARAHDRILKVARSVADLENSEVIQPSHIGEAIQYRSLDRLGQQL